MREGREQREWIRIAVDLPAKYRIIDGPARYDIMRIVDIHHRGGCFQAAQHLSKGEKVRIILEIPFEGQVNFTAEVAWCFPMNDEDDYRTGVKFIVDGPQAEENCHKLYHFCLLQQPKG